ncbi:MAG TPA: branched-chain amino acid transaminase [Cyclobacteriaceae bacterium]
MYFNNQTWLFQNGNWVRAGQASTSIYSQTLHYGYGIFDGLRAYKTAMGPRLFRATEHYTRLLKAAREMNIEINYSVEELIEISYQLLDKNNLQSAYVRPLIYVGNNMRLSQTPQANIAIASWKWGRYLGFELLKVMISSYEKPSPKALPVNYKVTGHYVNSIMATSEAKAKGFDEALLLDNQGNISQGPGANFFCEKDGCIYTPKKGNILAGITRSVIFEMAEDLSIPIYEVDMTAEELTAVDFAFFVGTATEIAGIKSIGGHEYEQPWEESIAYSLLLTYREKIKEEGFQKDSVII